MRVLLLFLFSIVAASSFAAGPDDDWAALLGLDAGPEKKAKTPAEAQVAALAHLKRQEKALRDFLKNYPSETRALEAKLRLARVLQIRADVQDAKVASPEIDALIRDAERTAKPEQRADVEFARISYTMRTLRDPTPQQRQRLLDDARRFEGSHPNDRRLAPLLVEVATLFDLQPKTKRQLLLAAQMSAREEELRARIADDMRRLDLLGQKLALRFEPVEGEPIDVAQYRGKVVVVVFFATWSEPSLEAVAKLEKSVASLPAGKIQVLGVSLDTRPEPLEALVESRKIDWPVICDRGGWESKMIRGFGINALPVVWLVDREGTLRSLDGSEATLTQLRELLLAR